jgi:predicted GNAT superfamily acetyltransferase
MMSPFDDPGPIRIETATDAAQLHEVGRLFNRVWGMAPGLWVIPPEVLVAAVHSGGAVHVAYDGDRMVAACAAVFCAPAQAAVYSLVAGVKTSDRGVGFVLKQAQRAWALANGASSMRWTFDPLVGRNARFNLMKLGAIGTHYAIDFYGVMRDKVQGDDETDRLTVHWQLDAPAAPAEVLAPTSPTGMAPDGGPLTARDNGLVWCRVPHDIVALRRTDPDQASRWRLAVREVMEPAFSKGYLATGMSRDGWYRLEQR